MMKRILLSLLFVAFWAAAHSQCVPVFTENFDGATVNMTSTGTPGWTIDNTLQVSGANSYRGRFSFGDSAILETPSFSTIGNTYVLLDFDHICKVNFFDRSQVEVSIDGGISWQVLDTSHYLNDSAAGFPGTFSFSHVDYLEWQFTNPLATPTNAWWKHETFDLSAFGEQADVRVRFNLYDFDNGTPNGMSGFYGWLIDNVNICMAPCEVIPPVIDLSTNTLQNTIYNTGPYVANAHISDASGIVFTEIHISTNGSAGPFVSTGVQGDPACPAPPVENYCFDIPAASVGDSICFFIVAFDGSPCFNSDTSGLACFLVDEGVVLTNCEDFDTDAVWVNNTVSGSNWEWGTPAFGATNSAHSAPNAWDVDLDAGYLAGTETYVVSPVYDFSSAVNPRLEFWYNSSVDNGSTDNDGVQIQFTLDPSGNSGWNTLGSFNDPAGTNWYNSGFVDAFDNLGVNDAWSGNSNGWKQAKYNLINAAGVPNAASVRFRFAFKSINTGEGFSIDDFCVILPPNNDPGLQSIVTPANNIGVASGAGIPVTVNLFNYGNATLTSANIVCETTGGTTISNTWAGTLAPGQFTNVNIDTILADPASFDLCCYIDDPANTELSNDTICHQLFIVPLLPLTYCDNFDSTNIGWTQQNSPVSATTTTWQLGTPAGSAPTGGPHSGTQAWAINLLTGYDDDAECYLYSPYFDFTNAGSAIMEFWHVSDVEDFFDGMHVEYSVDNGTNWNVLGTVGDPNATNWYNETSITGPSGITTEGWSITDGNWMQSTYKLCSNPDLNMQPNPVQFRFAFITDFTVVDGNGYAIDDFCIYSSTNDDIGVSAIIAPNPSAPSAATVNATVEVTNYGGTTINGFPITYIDPNTNLPVTFNSSVVLPPCTTITIVLPTSFTVPNTNFTLCAYTGLATDTDNSNDTLCIPVISVQTFTPSFCDGFDGTNYWYTENFGNPQTNWELGTPNNALGVTIGALSAPNAWDINLTSDYTTNADVVLVSPYFDFSTAVNASLKFWQNRALNGNDGLYVEYKEDVSTTWTVLGVENDTNGVNWYNTDFITNGEPGWIDYSSGSVGVPLWIQSIYNLNNFSNSGRYQFRFHFVSSGFSTGDGVSIDSFCISLPPPQDAGVIAIMSPTGLALTNSTSTLRVTIKNFGSQPFSSTDIHWQQSTGGTGTFTWTGAPLLPNQSLTVNNIGTINSGTGPYDLCVWTTLPSDGDNSNDTTCRSVNVVNGIPVTFLDPYFENFDTDGGWTSATDPQGSPTTLWEFGVPAFGQTTGAYSAPTCWDINLTTEYFGNAYAYLYSPYFDFSNALDARLSFWHNYDTETNWDGNRIEYTTDGDNWNVLGEADDSCGLFGGMLTWYTTDDLFATADGLPGWEGSSPNWVQAYYDLNCRYLDFDNTGVVQFRFVFESDGIIEGDGYSVDDFGIEVPIPVTVAPQTITAMCTSPQTLLLFPFAPTQFSTPIKNKGTNDATSCQATLIIDNNLIVTDNVTFTPSLKKDSVQIWNFSVQPILTPGCHEVIVYTSNPNSTADQNPFDDTLRTTVCVFDTTTVWPYCNDFESGTEWVSLNAVSYIAGDEWELGVPSQPFLNSAHSGTNAWSLNLDADYSDLDTSGLFSPVMTVLGNHCYRIGFYHQFRMEEFMDGGIVEYSTDLGQTWTIINFNTIFGNSDNYDYVTALSSLGNPVNGFTGNSDGWVYSEKTFRPGVTASLIIRWRFQSEYTRDDEGWTIDDVCIVDAGACNPLGIEEVTESGLGLGQNYPNPFNGNTTIEYTIPEKGNVQLMVTDAVGRVISQLQDAEHVPGDYSVDFNSSRLKPGVYFYTLTFNNESITKRMMITE